MAAQIAFPILAVAASSRHAALVCLSGRLRVIVARSVRLRDLPTEKSSVRRVLARFELEAALRAPGTVVVENAGDRLMEAIAQHARAAGCRLVVLSFATACERIMGRADGRETALVLLRRYKPLEKRLAPRGTPLFRHERWRESKPLAMAFALAHAVALEVLTESARPLGSGPPPSP
jgi:hypothetical protein